MTSLAWLLLAANLPYTLADDDWTPTSEEVKAEAETWQLIQYTFVTWACVIAALLVFRWTTVLLQHLRRVVNLNQNASHYGRQRYFTIPNESWAEFKQYWLMAPLLKKRHNREIRLSKALNVGTIPSRMQTFAVVCYFAINIATCAVGIHWHRPTYVLLTDACNRTGTMATLNMIPLFLLAGRNNPLIWLLGINFDSYNLIHRWIGRIVVIEAVLHGTAWMARTVITEGWKSIAPQMADTSDNMVLTGTIGAAAFVAILLQSPSIVRHAFYETFLHTHILLAFVSVVVIWIHIDGMRQQALLLAAILCWAVERAMRFASLIRRNFGRGITKAEVEALPGDAVRITLRVARPWTFRPGQHIYMYMPSVGMWTSHPFSLAWSQESRNTLNEKALPLARQDILAAAAVADTKSSSVSLVVRRRTGFTNRMWHRASSSTTGKFLTTAFVEGPYGGQRTNFHSYGTVMLFAAGVGITHQIPHVRDLLTAYAAGTCATRKVILIWIIRSPEHLEWIRPWMTSILGMEKRRDVLKILLFITRPRSTREIHSPSSSVQMFPGKPDVGSLVSKEQEGQVGAMVVSCCGTGSLSDDVRAVVRERCGRTEMDFEEEAFSW